MFSDRHEARIYLATVGRPLGIVAAACIALLFVLAALRMLPDAWPPLIGIAFWLSASGVVSSLVAMRRPLLRPRALKSLAFALPPFVASLFAQVLLWKVATR